MTKPTSPIEKREQVDAITTTVKLSCVNKADTAHHATETILESSSLMESRQAPKTQISKTEMIQKLQKRMPTTEQQFRKGIVSIFLALLICHLLVFVNEFCFFEKKCINSVIS